MGKPERIEEPDQDLRLLGSLANTEPEGAKLPDAPPKVGQPDLDVPKEEGLQPVEPPEPLFLSREEQVENYYRLVEEETNREFLHVAEVVKIRSVSQILPFMRNSMATYKLARVAPGFVAGGIKAKWWRKTFWSYLVWEDENYLQRFNTKRGDVSLSAWIQQNSGPGSCYVTWIARGEPSWDEALTRLEHPTNYYCDPWVG